MSATPEASHELEALLKRRRRLRRRIKWLRFKYHVLDPIIVLLGLDKNQDD